MANPDFTTYSPAHCRSRCSQIDSCFCSCYHDDAMTTMTTISCLGANASVNCDDGGPWRRHVERWIDDPDGSMSLISKASVIWTVETENGGDHNDGHGLSEKIRLCLLSCPWNAKSHPCSPFYPWNENIRPYFPSCPWIEIDGDAL